MIEYHEIQILVGVFITSLISGILGMGGGMLLMAIFSFILPLQHAMILHGLTQFSSNGFRAYLLKKEIKFNLLFPYLIGAILMFLFFRTMKFVPNLGVFYILLGLFPFVSLLPKISSFFNISKANRPIICGSMVMSAQILAGASGAILDIFFINSNLTRHQIIATKAFTQAFGHFIKLVYYLSLLLTFDFFTKIDIKIYPLIIIFSFLGTFIGKKILDKLSEKKFRKISKLIILTIATSLLIKGISIFIII